jgi:aryl-alcohol dehydrogenase
VRYAFDTTGNEQALGDAIDALCMGGECGLVTTPARVAPGGLLGRTATLRGIIQGSALPNDFLPKIIEWQRAGLFPYERLIRTYEFADIDQAFADSMSGKTVKPVLLMPN